MHIHRNECEPSFAPFVLLEFLKTTVWMQQKKMLMVLKLYFAVILTNITKYKKGPKTTAPFPMQSRVSPYCSRIPPGMRPKHVF